MEEKRPNAGEMATKTYA